MIWITLAAVAAAFIIGWLAGENRAVRQANTILDERTRDLLEIMRDEVHGAEGETENDNQPAGPTMH